MKNALIFIVAIIISFSAKAQIYTPGGTIQGTSVNYNIGIGTQNPVAKLSIQAGPDGHPTPLKAISISGPNTPANANSAQDLSWDFAAAGSAAIRSYRGSNFDTYMQFMTNSFYAGGNVPQVRMHISENGNVGIGTTNPTSKLTVAGNINSREVKVTVDAGADFVFDNNYKLPSLESVDKYVKENKHLPEIASASEMQKVGINLSEMNIKLLQKVEELTLYAIEQQKNTNKLTQIIEEQNKRLKALEEIKK